jgi:Putative zinc-finger
VNCLAARERLPEHALSTLASRDRSAVDRHLAWCAACRKEVGQLEEAAAVLGYAAAPSDPVPGLEERVVRAVQTRASRESAVHRRMRIAVGAAIVATVLAIGGLGWGAVAVMAKRQSPAEAQAGQIQAAALRDAKIAFSGILEGVSGTGSGASVSLADLVAPGDGNGEGWGLVMVLADRSDLAGVKVANLGQNGERGPFSVELVSAAGRAIPLGRIPGLDDRGAGELFTRLRSNLTDAREIVVRDARGEAVLRGSLHAQNPA